VVSMSESSGLILYWTVPVTCQTWCRWIGCGVRREWPGGRGQIEGLVPRKLVEEGRSMSLASGCARGRTVGLETRRRLYARQVFDVWSAHRARSREGNRKQTNLGAGVGSISPYRGRLVARLHEQGSPFQKKIVHANVIQGK
jgi:hypothetical protein